MWQARDEGRHRGQTSTVSVPPNHPYVTPPPIPQRLSSDGGSWCVASRSRPTRSSARSRGRGRRRCAIPASRSRASTVTEARPAVRARGAARAGISSARRSSPMSGSPRGRRAGPSARRSATAMPDGSVLIDLYDVWLGEAALPGRVVASVYRATIDGPDGVGGSVAGPWRRRLGPAAADDPPANGRAATGPCSTTSGRSSGTSRCGNATTAIEIVMELRHDPEKGVGRPEEVLAELAARSGVALDDASSSASASSSLRIVANAGSRAARRRSRRASIIGRGRSALGGRLRHQASMRRGLKCSQPSRWLSRSVVRQARVAQPEQGAVAIRLERRPRRGCRPVARPPPDPPSPT